jgi:hypothetical protein
VEACWGGSNGLSKNDQDDEGIYGGETKEADCSWLCSKTLGRTRPPLPPLFASSLLFSRSSALFVIIFSSPPTSGSSFNGKLDGSGSIVGLKTLVFRVEDEEEDDSMA